jgi:hypothetical protein
VSRKLNDLTGLSAGRLLVLEYVGIKNKRSMWNCLCECGACVAKSATSIKRAGKNLSCGCVKRGQKHLMCGTPEYGTWSAMQQRCGNHKFKQYQDYGGRGISVCERWKVFENFFEDMGHRPQGMTLDRIDNDGMYEKSNCKWSTRSEQQNNRRDCRKFELNGEFLTITEISRKANISRTTLFLRLQKNLSVKEAITHKKWKHI